MESGGGRRIRFGTFEADPVAGELRRGGQRVNLQDQPFRLLLLLLERAGELVSRDEIRRALWGETFVDFDEGLNTAVRKLRDALGDSASNPRFIETLPRRGYRFIAPVEVLGEPEAPPPQPVAAPARRWRWIAGTAIIAGATAILLIRGWFVRELGFVLASPIQLTRDTGLTTDPVISRDGKLIAYASDRSGERNLDIWVQHAAGGEPKRISFDGADDHQPDIAPDGSQIIFRSEREGGGIYAVSTLGGESRLLIPRAYVPRFSPDGGRLAYARGTFGTGSFVGELYVQDVPAGEARAIALNATTLGPAVWSPDGKLLAFVGEAREGGDGVHLWMCFAEGKPAWKLTSKPIGGPSLYFGPPQTVSVAWWGEAIVLSISEGDSASLWAGVVDRASNRLKGEMKRITVGSGNEVMPSISTNGRMVFASRVQSSNIWTVNPAKADTTLRPLTNDRARNLRPSISADGSKMAYVSDRGGDFDVYVKNLIDGADRVVARTPVRESYAAISRDGSEVASYDSHDLWITRTNGGTPRLLCRQCERPEGWTPEGALLVWAASSGRHTGLRDVRTGSLVELFAPGTAAPVAPALSPDGKWVVFHILVARGSDKSVPPLRRIFLARYAGQPLQQSEWIPVTDGTGLDREPRWSADGNRIYFLSDRDGARCIWARDLDTQTKEPRGAAYPAVHLHDARLSLSHIANTGQVSINARGADLIFAMGELTSNVWMADLRRQSGSAR